MNHDFIFMNLISFSSLWKYVVKGQISARIESHVSKIESALVQTIGYKLLIVGLISTLRSVPAIIADSLWIYMILNLSQMLQLNKTSTSLVEELIRSNFDLSCT